MKKLCLILSLLIFVPLVCFSQETLTITTYYPAPSGAYQQLTSNYLTVNPQTTAPTPATGMLYWDDGGGQGGVPGFYYYDGGGWNLLGGVGGGSLWTESAGNIYRDTGNVGIGTDTPQSQLHIASGGGTEEIVQGASNTANPILTFRRAKGTLGLPQVVSNGNTLGGISILGYDGAAFRQAAAILGQVDGSPGSSDMPGRLIFATTPDGSNTAVERMRIHNSGRIGIGTTDDPWGLLDIYDSEDASGGVQFVVQRQQEDSYEQASIGVSDSQTTWLMGLTSNSYNSFTTPSLAPEHAFFIQSANTLEYGLVIDNPVSGQKPRVGIGGVSAPYLNLTVKGSHNLNPLFPEALEGKVVDVMITMATDVPSDKTLYIFNLTVNPVPTVNMDFFIEGEAYYWLPYLASPSASCGSAKANNINFKSPLVVAGGNTISATTVVGASPVRLVGYLVDSSADVEIVNTVITNSADYTVSGGVLFILTAHNQGNSGNLLTLQGVPNNSNICTFEALESKSFNNPIIVPNGRKLRSTCAAKIAITGYKLNIPSSSSQNMF